MPLGPTVQSKPDFCPFCDGRHLVKRGLRKNSFRQLQMYRCKDCRKYFSSLTGLKGAKYPPRVIARALCLYNLGHSQEEAARRIKSEHRITVPRRTISDWILGYRSITTLHRLRATAMLEFPDGMLREKTQNHGCLKEPESTKLRGASPWRFEICVRTVPPCTRVHRRISFTRLKEGCTPFEFYDSPRGKTFAIGYTEFSVGTVP